MEATKIKELEARLKELQTQVKEVEAELARARFLALPKDMTLDDQYKALREHKDTPMTYSEMRERFG